MGKTFREGGRVGFGDFTPEDPFRGFTLQHDVWQPRPVTDLAPETTYLLNQSSGLGGTTAGQEAG